MNPAVNTPETDNATPGLRVAVASGKGGTGKTTVAVNLATLLATKGVEVTYADCDVEAPNGHLFLRPTVEVSVPVTVPVPCVDTDKCTLCGACGDACRYSAIVALPRQVLTFPKLCHGCGGCRLVCTAGAVTEAPRETGVVERGRSGGIAVVQGLMTVGESMAPPVIRAVLETLPGSGIQILDAPPGTSCPVIKTVAGADVAVLVTEPTPFGLNDLKLAVEMMRALGKPFGVVINRAGLGDDRVERYCEAEGIPVLGALPNDRRVAEAYSRGLVAVTVLPEWERTFSTLWKRIVDLSKTPLSVVDTESASRRNLQDENRDVGAAPLPYRETPDVPELVIISGKGGTGKTGVSASFAALAKNAALADCDVDAADLHLVTSPEVRQSGLFSGGRHAVVETARCTACGLCQTVCRFDAIAPDASVPSTYRCNEISCEGCGVCVDACPEEAIVFEKSINGKWFVSDTRLGTMAHARLGIASENSGKLVALVRKKGREITVDRNRSLLVCDGSPGIGCPVISSLTGARGALIVSEPTLSGLHDMERAAKLCADLGVRAGVCVNKADINLDAASKIESRAEALGLVALGRIRYDESVVSAQTEGLSIVEHSNGPAADDIRRLWNNVRENLLKDDSERGVKQE